MTRARILKPGFFLNEQLAELPYPARILFQALWCIADRSGRLEDRPKRIKHEALPYDNEDVDDLLAQLNDAGFIQRYAVDGERYIQVVHFTKHQSPHIREAQSQIPAPPSLTCLTGEHGASTRQAPDKHQTSPAVPNSIAVPNSVSVTPTVSDAPTADVDEPPAGDFAPTARMNGKTSSSQHSHPTLPERRASDTTDRIYWTRILKEADDKHRLPLLVQLAHEKIGVTDGKGGAAYGRLGKLAKEHGAALVAGWILQAAAGHIDGDPLDYLTKIANGQSARASPNGRNGQNGHRPVTAATASRPIITVDDVYPD